MSTKRSLVVVVIVLLATQAASRVTIPRNYPIASKDATSLGYLSLSLSPTKIIALEPGGIKFYCCPISCDANLPSKSGKNIKFSYQNPDNPSFIQNTYNARFQTFQLYGDNTHTYNKPENVVNYCDNNQGGYEYRSDTTVPFNPDVYPNGTQICVAVQSANGGSFSFLIQRTNEPVSVQVWKRGNTTKMDGDPSSDTRYTMRQFLQFVPHVHTVANRDEITFKTRFCTSRRRWQATLRVSATTPLSAFYSYACAPSVTCGYATSRNWISADPSGTSYNVVPVTQNNISIPDIQWAVYGFGANTNGINNFSLYVEFKG